MLGFVRMMDEGERVMADDMYYFDSLEKNNMITGKNVIDELQKKYAIRRKLMQERIDSVDPETREKYDTPSPATYAAYQTTQTIYDDMNGEKKFE
jgi:hypothetical protein